MHDYIQKRVLTVAQHIVSTQCTLRQAGKVFHHSKSTIHKDMQSRLKAIDRQLWQQVQAVLANNLATRHLRGGESTRKKYAQQR